MERILSPFSSPAGVKSNGTISEWHHHQAFTDSQKKFRMLEVLGILPEQIFWKGRKVILTQTADKERAAEDVVDIAIIVPQGSVVAQAQQFSFVVTHDGDRVGEWIYCLNGASHEFLHGLKRPMSKGISL